MATGKLGLELLANSAANQTLANLTFVTLNQAVQLCVLDKDLATPPGSPTDEAAYIVASGATGDWSGHVAEIAWWSADANAWQFIEPKLGWMASVVDELDASGIPKRYGYSGSAWALPESSTAGSAPPVVVDSTTARVAGLTDNLRYLNFTNAGSVTLTISPQSSVAWADDTEFYFRRDAAASLTVIAGSGVTIKPPSGGSLILGENMTCAIKRASSDVWHLIGHTEPA